MLLVVFFWTIYGFREQWKAAGFFSVCWQGTKCAGEWFTASFFDWIQFICTNTKDAKLTSWLLFPSFHSELNAKFRQKSFLPLLFWSKNSRHRRIIAACRKENDGWFASSKSDYGLFGDSPFGPFYSWARNANSFAVVHVDTAQRANKTQFLAKKKLCMIEVVSQNISIATT